MIHCWRWFGPDDPITLSDIRQVGATGIVTALHHLPVGAEWGEALIGERKALIEEAGLKWEVVESVPVPEEVKAGLPGWEAAAEIWATNIRRLGRAGIRTVCYNFMPVLDWTRTEVDHPLQDGSRALRFDFSSYAAFDLFVLARPGARADYTSAQIDAAQQRFEVLSLEEAKTLSRTILSGLPGSEESYTIESFRERITHYRDIDPEQMRKNLGAFLDIVLPAAEAEGVKLALHPDDPPQSLFGLPKVVSTLEDMLAVRALNPQPANGFTLCTGSLGSRMDNDVEEIARVLAPHVYFAHLRAVRHEEDKLSFCEDHHLGGNFEMTRVIGTLLKEESNRGRPIPMRPDHGLRMLDDLGRETPPGYPLLGRLRGLAELRGVEHAIRCMC